MQFVNLDWIRGKEEQKNSHERHFLDNWINMNMDCILGDINELIKVMSFSCNNGFMVIQNVTLGRFILNSFIGEAAIYRDVDKVKQGG